MSTAEQAEEGHSLDAQRSAIAQFCEARDWELVGIKADAGISGTMDERPALEEMLAAVEHGCCDAVVVHAIDRFYRDLQGLLGALNHLRQHNVTFTSITENLDFSTPWGKLALAVLGTLAEIYIDRLRAETRKERRARAAKGLQTGRLRWGTATARVHRAKILTARGTAPASGPRIVRATPRRNPCCIILLTTRQRS